MRTIRTGLLSVLFAALAAGPTWAQTPPGTFVNFEGAQTNPIRISADGTRLFAVNTPNGTLSVFCVAASCGGTASSPALIAEIPVGIEPVSVNINPGVAGNDEAWVTNQISNSVSVVSVSKGIVTDTLSAKPEPEDVVFTPNGLAWVSVARANMVNVYNAGTHALVQSISLVGTEPRALAVSPNGKTVYTAFALSGNHSTIVPNTAKGLPQNQTPWPSDMNSMFQTSPNLPPTVGLIVDASDPTWSSVIQYTMPDNDVAAINATNFNVSYYSHLGTDNMGLAVSPNGNLYVANMDALNLVYFQTALNGHDVNNQITTVNVSNGQSQMFDLNPNVNYGQLPNTEALATALAMPTAIVFEPTAGRYLYIAAFGTDRVGIFDTTTNTVASFVEINPQALGPIANPSTKRGPRGLAFNSPANMLYVLNRISNTISVVNVASLATGSVVKEIATGSTDPTPSVIKNGRGFLYDAKLSGNGTNSCASCHVDAEIDLLAWNLGNPPGDYTYLYEPNSNEKTTLFAFHPMKGPMTTQSLRGLANVEPYHWRGDKPNLAAFNGAFSALMGGSELSTADMAAFTNFINTVVYQPNPNENLDGTLPDSIALLDHPGVTANPNTGYTTFTTVQFGNFGQGDDTTQTCSFCHTAPASIPGYAPGTNLLVRIPFGSGPGADQPLKIPHLRNMYWKTNANFNKGAVSVNGFGYGHEGNIAGLANQANQGSFGIFSTKFNTNDPAQAVQLDEEVEAYELCFDTGTPPATGYSRTLTSTTVGTSGAQSDWTTLQSLAGAGAIDLIANGTVNGKVIALLYQSGSYITNTTGVGPFTQAQLTTFINNGDTLTIMGVPFGSGSRMINTKLASVKR
jgi:DNA-binding beta-propeller fold protein YncE